MQNPLARWATEKRLPAVADQVTELLKKLRIDTAQGAPLS